MPADQTPSSATARPGVPTILEPPRRSDQTAARSRLVEQVLKLRNAEARAGRASRSAVPPGS